MALKTTSCRGCGNSVSYDDSNYATSSIEDLVFGRLCTACKHRRDDDEQRKKDRRSEEDRLERNQEQRKAYEARQEEQFERDREERRAYAARQEELAEELADREENPGDYECPGCRYVTLRANAWRCPKCHYDIPSSYWDQVRREYEAAQKEAERARAEEARHAPLREAQLLVASIRKLVNQKIEHWNSLFWAIALGIGSLGTLFVCTKILGLQSRGGPSFFAVLIAFACSIVNFIAMCLIPILALRSIWLMIMTPIRIGTIDI